jgi:hypothetical protein
MNKANYAISSAERQARIDLAFWNERSDLQPYYCSGPR